MDGLRAKWDPGMLVDPGNMGPGMMMNPGVAGQGRMQPFRDNLSADDDNHMMEHHLIWQGNPNIKLGKVQQIGEDSIVTKDG